MDTRDATTCHLMAEEGLFTGLGSGLRHHLLVVHQLLADLAGIEAVQAAVAFGGPAGVLGLEAVVDEAPLVAWIQPGTGNAEPRSESAFVIIHGDGSTQGAGALCS